MWAMVRTSISSECGRAEVVPLTWRLEFLVDVRLPGLLGPSAGVQSLGDKPRTVSGVGGVKDGAAFNLWQGRFAWVASGKNPYGMQRVQM